MNRDYRDKLNQQNTRDRRKNLRCWRHHKENKYTDQRKQQIQLILITKHPGNLWHNKNTNLRIIGVEDGEELHFKVSESIFNKISVENFPNLKKDIPMKTQEAYRTLNRLDQKNPLTI